MSAAYNTAYNTDDRMLKPLKLSGNYMYQTL
jgi:hypothetical protein